MPIANDARRIRYHVDEEGIKNDLRAGRVFSPVQSSLREWLGYRSCRGRRGRPPAEHLRFRPGRAGATEREKERDRLILDIVLSELRVTR